MQLKNYNFSEISEIQNYRFSQGRIATSQDGNFFLKCATDSDASTQQFLNELSFRAACPTAQNILPAVGKTELEGSTYLVFPLVQNDLVDLVGKVSEDVLIKHILIPLLQALADIHHRDWIHADVKLENIRVDLNANPIQIYLSDFGKALPLNDLHPNRIGALSQHIPPDLTLGPQADIYGVGVLAFQLLFGFDFIKKYQMVGRDFSKIPESKNISERLLNFIAKATEPSALSRIKNTTQAKALLLGTAPVADSQAVRSYNLGHYFEFYLECMRDIFISSNRATTDFEKFIGPWGQDYYARLKRWLGSPSALIVHLEHNQDLIGICEATISQGVGKISSIFISSEFRGLGHATTLEEHTLDFFSKANVSKAILNVETSNQPAIAFYKKRGWQQTLERQYETAFQFEKIIG
jgi:serine/threonine protein kinase